MTREQQRKLALKMFRTVQGEGDCGSEQEFNCRNVTEQAGWMRLAATVGAYIERASKFRSSSKWYSSAWRDSVISLHHISQSSRCKMTRLNALVFLSVFPKESVDKIIQSNRNR